MPVESTVPTLALPPTIPSTAQVRSDGLSPQALAWNCCVPETITDAVTGIIDTPEPERTVISVVALLVRKSTLVAFMLWIEALVVAVYSRVLEMNRAAVER